MQSIPLTTKVKTKAYCMSYKMSKTNEKANQYMHFQYDSILSKHLKNVIFVLRNSLKLHILFSFDVLESKGTAKFKRHLRPKNTSIYLIRHASA